MVDKHDYEKSLTGAMKDVDERYYTENYIYSVNGNDTAGHMVGFAVGLTIVEIVVALIIGETSNIDKSAIMFFIFYSIIKNAIFGCVFLGLANKLSEESARWTKDKKKLGLVKYCLKNMEMIEKDDNPTDDSYNPDDYDNIIE